MAPAGVWYESTDYEKVCGPTLVSQAKWPLGCNSRGWSADSCVTGAVAAFVLLQVNVVVSLSVVRSPAR